MAGVLLLIGSALGGFAFVRRLLGQTLRFTEQLFWGIAVGWLLSSAGGYLLARALGKLSFGVVPAITLGVWLFASLLLLRELRLLRQIQFKHAWQREHTGLD